ncbi:MAG TPA: class I SAM-dependent methyltransferase [Gaiellaceae bacterium]|nr:class I SAM-dependent methyltransferase [Gaiellaceae bacterium]
MPETQQSVSTSTRVHRASSQTIGRVTPWLPSSIKRPIRRALPRRYWRYFDPDWHRRAIGLPWEAMGKLQFDFLVDQGLKPEHHLLDVGCGPLRAGVHFMAYLEPGHYFGVEKRADLLEAGRDVEMPRSGVVGRNPTLVVMEDFDFRRLDQTFDFAIAQSVFTHLPINNVIRCLVRMSEVLVPGGRFFASIWENEQGKRNLEPIQQRPDIATHFDRNPFHYDFAAFEWMCAGTDLVPEYIGEWNNPRNQKMLVFTKS